MTNPYDSPGDDNKVYIQKVSFGTLVIGLITCFGLAVLCSGCLLLLNQGDVLQQWKLPTGKVLTVYAEPAFHYEPPGYLTFDVRQDGRLTIPERRFMPIGIERVPTVPFQLVVKDNGNVIALVHGRDVKMMHEFSTNSTFPGRYAVVDEENVKLAERLLAIIVVNEEGWSCSELENYRRLHP